MSTTRAAIRRRAVHLSRANGRSRGFATRDGVNALVSTGGAAATLIDTAGLPPGGAATTTAKGDWLYLPAMTAANQKRIISSYLATSQQFTHGLPNYDATTITALGVGTPYLVLKDDPDLWNSAINEALVSLLSTIEYDEFTPTGLTRYNVASSPISLTSIIRPSQIADVEVRNPNDAAGYENYEPWADGYRTWKAYYDHDDVILDFGDDGRAPQSTDKIRIKWSNEYATVSSESTSIDVDELLAALGTLVKMADWLADPNNPDDDWRVIGRRVGEEYDTRRRLILGTDAYRQVQRTVQQTGIIRMRGRGGR